ncbi:MAG: D-isomer specific 2-hydroxyacid dehydrogenase [Verrucomicrobia bacterium]|jgi:phosphoglycerate dehydrogenase-like enzyme|nr:D-isomer specific 2-hydroxyacid dehydrogenase [Verrucomicrobiota bacterium]
MKNLKIFCDTFLGNAALKQLREGVAPHELIFPAEMVNSPLAKSDPDPAFAEADIAFGQPDVANILQSTRLKWAHISSAGFTRYDTPEFRAFAAKHDIQLTNSSTVYAEACAEHVFAFMLAQARHLPESLGVRHKNATPEWLNLRHTSPLLQHQRVVILGFGGIAIRLLEILRPFHMNVVAYRRKVRGDEGIPIITAAELPDALAEADHVINILPANADSQNFISTERLNQMKRGAIFYNIGRGTTVDQEALAVALRSGQLGAAWLDVTEPEPLPEGHPLLSLPNCYITPHVAGGHQGEAENLIGHFLKNFRRYLDEAPLVDRIM